MNVPLPRLTAIGSGKGGTGKTLISLALAQALAKQGERVLLCDADLGLSNTPVHLGLAEGGDLAGVLAGRRAIGDAVVRVNGGAIARGFDLLAAPAGSGALANAGADAAIRLIALLRAAHAYDRAVLDLGAGVDVVPMSMAAAADETIAILTPDPAALTDAYAFTKLLVRATRSRQPEFIVNLATNDAEARRTAEAFTGTCRAFLKFEPHLLGIVPRDAAAADAVRRQQALGPASAAMRAVTDLAISLHVRITPRKFAANDVR
ncbi:MAG TPA: AAA family ATPase [Rhizomicrobium sp.]